MLAAYFYNCGREFIFGKQRYAVLLVGNYGLRTFERRQRIVYILAILLILFEVQRPSQLAYVVIIRANACKQRIRAYALGRAFGKRGNIYAVLICAGRLHHKLP